MRKVAQHLAPIQREGVPINDDQSLEEEADRMGAKAMQTKPADAPVQRHKEEVAENKTGLPDQLKSGVEALSGMSLDNVKVHYNSDKPSQLQALAYAQGTDIHVGPGQEKHLPHEAWHVVQQAQGRVRPTTQMKRVESSQSESTTKHAVPRTAGGETQLKVGRTTQANNAFVRGAGGVLQRDVDTTDSEVYEELVTRLKKVCEEHSTRASDGADGIIETWLATTEANDSLDDNDSTIETVANDFAEYLEEEDTRESPANIIRRAETDEYSVQSAKFIDVKSDLGDGWYFEHLTIEGYATSDSDLQGPVYVHAQLRLQGGTSRSRSSLKNFYLQLNSNNSKIGTVPKNQAGNDLGNNENTWKPGDVPDSVKTQVFILVRDLAYS
ncbi:MAG: DUF4157 domain-containing protein [Burkholderiales bacterium]|nr:DUF4157 domain-containing protein [Burkholderiales bacterium]